MRDRHSATLIASGFAAAGFQTILLREGLVSTAGNEVSVALLFFFWLSGVSLGAVFAVRMQTLSRHLPALFALFILLWTLWIVPARLVRELLPLTAGALPDITHITLYAAITTLIPGMVIGFIFPLAVGWAGISVRKAFALESIGAALGGCVITFLLIPYLTPTAQAGWIASLSLILTLRRPLFLLSLPILAIIVSPLSSTLDSSLERARWQSFGIAVDLIQPHHSRYQHIAIAQLEETSILYTNGLYAGSCPDEFGADARLRPLLAQTPAPSSILLLGGLPGVDEEPLLCNTTSSLVHVHLDPDFMRYWSEACPSSGDPRVETAVEDPFTYVKTADKHFDLIVSIVPAPSSILLNRFFTVEFFQDVLAILKPGGVFAVRMDSSVNYLGAETGTYLRSVVRSAQAVFPEVSITPGETAYILMGEKETTMTLDPVILRQRALSLDLERDTFHPDIFEYLYPEERVHSLALRLDEFSTPPNTLDRPMTFLRNLALQQKIQGRASLSHLILKIQPGYLFLFSVLAGLLVILLMRKKIPLAVVGSTGAVGMGGSFLLMVAFQIHAGILYAWIGFLTALFMVGIFLGSILSRRINLPAADLITLAALLTLFTLPLVPTPVYIGLFLLLGIATGIPFPLAARACGDGTSGAAMSEIADHAGAAMGAICTGVLFLPLLGFKATLLLFITIKTMTLILTLLSPRRTS